ncbi:hypothetical protein K502DRAFT_353389 [Neoconidiobolus thromboides FSU 785]|nr:hypothetical protein K502DRAFT_353389 [Neoconidiobolus thromboides FSU 785]
MKITIFQRREHDYGYGYEDKYERLINTNNHELGVVAYYGNNKDKYVPPVIIYLDSPSACRLQTESWIQNSLNH